MVPATELNGFDNPVVAASPSNAIVNQTTEVEFETLEAACWAAKDGDVIVLSYNGLLRDSSGAIVSEKTPLRIWNRDLTIRAATGFEPVVRFDLGEETFEVEARFIDVKDGSLQLSGVDLQMVIREEPYTDRWVLFSINGPAQQPVRLTNTTVEVFNLSRFPTDTTIFECGPAIPLREAMPGDKSEMVDDYEIELQRCWIRGECTLFTIANAIDGRIEMANSAAVIKGNLLHVTGVVDNGEVISDGQLDIYLEHVTSLNERLLLLADSATSGISPQRAMPRIDITAHDSIFAALPSSPGQLLYMEGNKSPSDYFRQLTWNGSRNWYDRYPTMWTVKPLSFPLNTEEFSGKQWVGHWDRSSRGEDNLAGFNELIWAEPEWQEAESLREIDRNALRLRSTSGSPSPVNGATDGTNAGADLSNLTGLRPMPRTEPPM